MANRYQLPFFSNDLNAGERYYTRDHAQNFLQKFGYDFSTRRRKSNGDWTRLKRGVTDHRTNPKNKNYIVYGKPFYAIADGKVVGGWRNAPENPRPKKGDDSEESRPWLHQAFKDKLMPGGGNLLFILNNDNSLTLYAHAQPGSIPSNLCPHNNALYDTPKSADDPKTEFGFHARIEVTNGATVKKGQFLGLIGNSGKSSGPHLHFHTQAKNRNNNWEGIPMRFERGLATPWNNGQADINDWESFRGDIIPQGEVLIWPQQILSQEYARHGMPAENFPRMFAHLADSGLMPEVIDGYSVGGKVFYNMIWRPADGMWRAYFGQTSERYQDKFEQAVQDGYVPVWVESYLSNGKSRYAAIFKKNRGKFIARHGLTIEQHEALLDQAKADNFQPVNISVVSINGKRRYTVLYRQVSIGAWKVRSRLSADAYQREVTNNKEQGLHPVYVNAYMHNGKANFSAVFAEKPSGSWRARHGLSSSDYQTEWESALQERFLTRVVSGYDGAQSTHKYVAVWRK